MKAACRFCTRLLRSVAPGSEAPWDRIVFRSEHFVVVPTLGSIIEGWLLIVPREHFLCIGEFSEVMLKELNAVCRVVSTVLGATYGPASFFEHGPSRPNELVGCGVDHAHLHAVCVGHDLLEPASNALGRVLDWRRVAGIHATKAIRSSGRSYLYVERPDGDAFVATDEHLPSQLLRKAIAIHAGCPDQFDWRQFAGRDAVERTFDTLVPVFRTVSTIRQTMESQHA